MARFYFDRKDLIEGYSAMISNHGYFTISKDESVEKLGLVYNVELDDIFHKNGESVNNKEILR